jgi:N-methylhydantoinase A/acetophenone carboxylase
VVNPEGGVFIESFILKAIVPTRKIELPRLRLEGKDPTGARKEDRPVFWPDVQSYVPTSIFNYEALRPGNAISGPAVVEGEYTTLVVPSSMTFSIDERGLGILEG